MSNWTLSLMSIEYESYSIIWLISLEKDNFKVVLDFFGLILTYPPIILCSCCCRKKWHNRIHAYNIQGEKCVVPRVSVQEVESLGGHFATLCWEFDFYEVKNKKCYYFFSRRKGNYFYTFNHFYTEKSSKRAK